MGVCVPCAERCPQRPEEDHRSPVTGVTDCCELNSEQEQQVPLSSDPSLQPRDWCFFMVDFDNFYFRNYI